MKRRRLLSIVAALALAFVALPLAWHFAFRYRVSAAEEARVAAAWAELEAWAAEVTPAPNGADRLAAVLDLVERAQEDDPEHLYEPELDEETGVTLLNLRRGLRREELPESWVAALDAFLAWHRADGGRGFELRYLENRSGGCVWLAELALALADEEPDVVAALARLGHVLRTRGNDVDYQLGLALVGFLIAAAEDGHALDSAHAARWRPELDELVHALVRDLVAAQRWAADMLAAGEGGDLSSSLEGTDAARVRYELHVFRRLATELFLPLRDEPFDVAELARAESEAVERTRGEEPNALLYLLITPSVLDDGSLRELIDDYDAAFGLR